MKNEEKKQLNVELYHLRKGFKALTIDHQKGVLKTARGLLRVQGIYKTIAENNVRDVSSSFKGQNE